MTPIGDKLVSAVISQLEINPDFVLLSDDEQLQYINLGQQRLNAMVNQKGLSDYSFNNLATALPLRPSNTLFVSPGYTGLSHPYYTVIQDAIDAASVGDVIRVSAGVYTSGFICDTKGISIIGDSAPEYDSYALALKGGVIIQLTGSDYCGALEESFVLKNIGIQRMNAGEGWISTGGSNNHHTYENIVITGAAHNDLYHCFLHEMGYDIQIKNIKTYRNAHGVAILSSYVIVDGVYGENNYYDNFIIKSKEGGAITDVTATNIVGRATTTNYNNGIRIQCINTGSSLARINISNASINGANVAGIYIDNDANGTISDVNIANTTVKLAVQYGFRIVADAASINKINFVNCIGISNTPNDFYNYNSAATNVRAVNCQGTFLGAFYQSDLLPAKTLYVSPTYTTMPAPFYSTVTAALAAAAVGDTIKVANGTYTAGFLCATKGISIIGDSEPEYDNTSSALKGGVIFQLTGADYCGCTAESFVLKNIGIERVDAGECWKSTGGANFHHNYSNIICVGKAYNDAYHCFLHEMGYNVEISNIRTYRNVHGIAILSSRTNLNNAICEDHNDADVIIKSKEGGTISDITISNIVGRATVTNHNNGIVLEAVVSGATPSTLYRVNISNVSINGANISGLYTTTDATSVITFVTVSNLNVTTAVQSGIYLAKGTIISLSNCLTSGCSPYGFNNVGAINVYESNCQGYGNGNLGASIFGDFSGLFLHRNANGYECFIRKTVVNATPTQIFKLTGPIPVAGASYRGGTYGCAIEGLATNNAYANQASCGGLMHKDVFTHSIQADGADGGASAVTQAYATATSKTASKGVTSVAVTVAEATNIATVSATVTKDDAGTPDLWVHWSVKIICSDMAGIPLIELI